MKRLIILVITFVAWYSQASEMRTVEADNLVLMTLETGEVLIELNPEVAPKHVAQFKTLLRQKKYDGKTFYRVIEGFVAQGGLNLADDDSSIKTLPMESEFAFQPNSLTHVQSPDLFAPTTGFYNGFAVAADPKQQKAWLTHCPGVLAMARGNAPDSATSDFYFVIGQAPRYLDRIMTIFGRVVSGFDAVQAIKRGKASQNGIIDDERQRTKILSVRLVSDLPATEQPVVEVISSGTASFKEMLEARRHRTHPFFFTPPPAVLDVCQIPLSVKVNGKLN